MRTFYSTENRHGCGMCSGTRLLVAAEAHRFRIIALMHAVFRSPTWK